MSISLSETSLRFLYTKSRSANEGRSSLNYSGGCLSNIFCISSNTSKALIKSGCSECNALVILEIHLKITLRIYLYSSLSFISKLWGIDYRKIYSKVTKEVVNSFEFKSLLTSFYTSTVISFCSISLLADYYETLKD